jgi:type IV secretory pathway VirB2 component (pilin)
MYNISRIDSDIIWKSFLFFCFLSILFTASDEALASTDIIGNKLGTLVCSLQGGVAKAVGTVAIMGVAGGLLMGKLQWTTAMVVSVGVIVIFSAGKIVAWIQGDTSVDLNCSTSTPAK